MRRPVHFLVSVCAVWATAATAATARPAQAQELARVSFQYRAPSGLTEPGPDDEAVEVTTYAFEATVLAPWSVSETVTLLLGAGYGWLRAEGTSPAGPGSEDFHEVGLSVGALLRVNPEWSLLGLVAPSLASDFEAVRGEAVNLRAVAQAAYRASERLTFSFGAVLSYDFGQLLPLPLLDLDWEPTRRDRLRIGFPRGVRYAHLFGDRVELGAALRLTGGRWALTDDMAQSLRTTNVDARAVFAVRLVGGLWWEASAGMALVRNVEVSERSSRDGFFDSRVDPTLVLETAFTFRLPRSSENPPRTPATEPEAAEDIETDVDTEDDARPKTDPTSRNPR